MTNLTPNTAAILAEAVYTAQSKLLVMDFLNRPEFSKNPAHKVALQAEVGFRLINAKDGFGVCALGGGQYEGDVFLMFRGSTSAHSGADWASNARCGVQMGFTNNWVHIGFNQIFSSMLDDIKNFLRSNLKPAGNVHCIGHSLGGAIATLTADYVSEFYANPVKLYTFGAPKNGMAGFVKKISTRMGENNIYRVYHQNDPVPMVPLYPFIHVPANDIGYRLPYGNAYISGEAHRVGSYIKSVSNSAWLQLKGGINPELTDTAIENWLKTESPGDVVSPTIWEKLNTALMYVVKRISHIHSTIFQIGLTCALTIADKIAWLLREGIELSKDIGGWVIYLMRKIMQVLQIKVVDTVEGLTRELMRYVLFRLMQRINEEVKKALRHF